MTEKLRLEILTLELAPDFENENPFIPSDPYYLSPTEFVDVVSCAVTDLETKLRMLREFRDTAEFPKDDQAQNELDAVDDTCRWLEQVVSQFRKPAAGTVMTARLMGFERLFSGEINYDHVVCLAGPFPTPNGDAALNAIRAYYSSELEYFVDSPQYWEIQVYDFSDEAGNHSFVKPARTYLSTLDGVLAYYRDERPYSDNRNHFDAGYPD